MAFNVQIPNSTRLQHRNWSDKSFLSDVRRMGTQAAASRHGVTPHSINTMYSYSQKVGHITPSLCFQADVFYPNAIAAVSNAAVESGNNENQSPPGCRGNQIQRDLPLESRIPVAVPLVQYPSPTSKLFLDQIDMCAAPVLNWEKYVENLKITVAGTRFRDKVMQKLRPLSANERRKKKMERWKRKCCGLPEENRPNLQDVPTSSSESEDECEQEISQNMDTLVENQGTTAANVTVPASSTNKKAKLQNTKKKPTYADMRKALFSDKPIKTFTDIKLRNLKKLKINKDTKEAPPKLAKSYLTVIKNRPKFKLEATWNYAFGGASGACCLTTKHNNEVLFVGNGAQVRQVVLEKSQTSMLSCRAQSVWEEDISNIPSHAKQESAIINPMTNIVHQILTPTGNFDLLGVRRGKSIDIYSIEEAVPYLLDSIPNVSYGSKKHTGKQIRNPGFVEDPLLLGLDFNPMYSAEFITIDENLQVRICDFTKESTVNTYHIDRPKRPGPNWHEFPKFQYINDAAGAQFAHHGQIFYAWANSKVLLGDRRSSSRSRAHLIDAFDLRRSVSSLSWSDQIYFNDSDIALNEYICSLRLSSKDNYYYVGTTARVFLLDARVPGQPVLKFEHGMPAAAYLHTFKDDAYEMIVAGSQRLGTTLCAITDHAHVKCFDRPECKSANPVLHCLPRHLSNSREFFDSVCSSGSDLSWEAEHQRAKTHNYAWTTGLAAAKSGGIHDSHEPCGILVFTSNVYGDVFCQELEQKPIQRHRKTEASDYKFKEFCKSWQSSMQSCSKTEFLKPSINPYDRIDSTFLIEPSARGIQRMTNVRQQPFDSMKVNELVHTVSEDNETIFREQVKKLRKHKSDIAQRCLDFWEYESSDDEEELVMIKQEVLDNEFNLRYGNEWNEDGTRDVEYLCNHQKGQQEVVDLNSQVDRDRESSVSSSSEELESDDDASTSDDDENEGNDGSSEEDDRPGTSRSNDNATNLPVTKTDTSYYEQAELLTNTKEVETSLVTRNPASDIDDFVGSQFYSQPVSDPSTAHDEFQSQPQNNEESQQEEDFPTSQPITRKEIRRSTRSTKKSGF